MVDETYDVVYNVEVLVFLKSHCEGSKNIVLKNVVQIRTTMAKKVFKKRKHLEIKTSGVLINFVKSKQPNN